MTNAWLLLDVGNTQTVAGIYAAPISNSEPPEAYCRVRFRTDARATADEYRAKIRSLISLETSDYRVSRVIVSSVVPALDSTLEEALSPLPCLFVSAEKKRDFELKLPSPHQLGADRLANIAGAMTLAQPPFLIVDAGTATTFCLVNKDAHYIGGSITPGLEIGWNALQAQAAKLFAVELDHPESAIGNTTETQLRSGVLLGYESLIEGLTDRLIAEAGSEFRNARFFATGGCVNHLKLSQRFEIETDLTLKGLLSYGEKNDS